MEEGGGGGGFRAAIFLRDSLCAFVATNTLWQTPSVVLGTPNLHIDGNS